MVMIQVLLYLSPPKSTVEKFQAGGWMPKPFIFESHSFEHRAPVFEKSDRQIQSADPLRSLYEFTESGEAKLIAFLQSLLAKETARIKRDFDATGFSGWTLKSICFKIWGESIRDFGILFRAFECGTPLSE